MFDQAAVQLSTVRDLLRFAVSRFTEAGLSFGHGSDNAYDEAVYLILHTLAAADRLEPFLDARLVDEEIRQVLDAGALRQSAHPGRLPDPRSLAGEYRFYVDERVIVPRSFIAELLPEALEPWIEYPELVHRALDMCTGSGCLAVLLADLYPDAEVDAVDLSADALAVAQINVEQYGLQERIELIQSDLFSAMAGREYDLIISNPPYVDAPSVAALPEEYRETGAGAGLGRRRPGRHPRNPCAAPAHLSEHGVLVVEIGHNREALKPVSPELPFTGCPPPAAMAFVPAHPRRTAGGASLLDVVHQVLPGLLWRARPGRAAPASHTKPSAAASWRRCAVQPDRQGRATTPGGFGAARRW